MITFKKHWLRIAAVAFMVIVFAISLVSPCAAISSSPTTLAVNYVNVFQNCLQTGDMLFIADYTVAYASTPTEPISATYILRLVNSSTSTDLGDSVPYAFFSNGYQGSPSSGVVSIYFTAAQVTALSLAWSSSGYYMVLAGNPAASWTGAVQSSTHIISSSFVWNGTVSVQQYILSEAIVLQSSWNSLSYQMVTPTGTGSGYLLTATGQEYFTAVLPSLATLAPSILISPSNAPFVLVSTPVVASPYSGQISSDFNGSALDPTAAASALKIPAMWLGIILTLGIIGFVVIHGSRETNSYKPLIILSLPLIYVFTRIGWFPMIITIGLGLVAALAIWWTFFGEKQIT
jgi:hypothetical protein